MYRSTFGSVSGRTIASLCAPVASSRNPRLASIISAAPIKRVSNAANKTTRPRHRGNVFLNVILFPPVLYFFVLLYDRLSGKVRMPSPAMHDRLCRRPIRRTECQKQPPPVRMLNFNCPLRRFQELFFESLGNFFLSGGRPIRVTPEEQARNPWASTSVSNP